MQIPTLLLATAVLASPPDPLPRRGMLGLPLAQVTSEARAEAKLGDQFGLLISQTPANGNAGDLQKGDVLTEINGKPFKSVQEFNELIRPTLAMPSLEVAFIREGAKKATTIKVLPKLDDEGPITPRLMTMWSAMAPEFA